MQPLRVNCASRVSVYVCRSTDAQVHALCEDDSVLGRAFYVMDYVPGRSAHPVGACSFSPPSGCLFGQLTHWVPVRSAHPLGAEV